VDGTGRYSLHELLRQFSAERLDGLYEEAEQTHDSHCRYYARFMESQWPRLTGREIKFALCDISAELDNVRTAWDWAVSHRRAAQVEAAMRSLWFFYGVGVRYQEGVQVFAIAAPAFSGDTTIYAKLLARWGELSFVTGSYRSAKSLLEESLPLLRQGGARDSLAFVLYRLAWMILGFDAASPKVTEFLEESLAIYTELDDRFGMGEVLLGWGRVHLHQYIRHGLDEALQRAQQCVQECLVAFQQHGSSFGIAVAHLMGLSSVADLLGDHRRSFQYAQTSLEFFQELGIGWGITWSLCSMAHAACGLGAYAEARQCALEILLFGFKVGWSNTGPWSLPNVHLVAAIMMGEGDKERAYELLGVVAQQRLRFGIQEDQISLFPPRLLEEKLPPHLAAAVERGRTRDLDTVVKEIFADLSSAESAITLPSLPLQPLIEPLSERELEILHLIADGHNSREVAQSLYLSVGTIRWYLKHIYSKLDAHSRSEAIARARQLNLLA
jgi:DNA-binding CsgD family transcriptional regulator